MKTEHCDVCVVGGGSAGVAAACSAARSGARVFLVERYGFLGGIGTGGILGTICGLYTSGPRPRPLPTWFGWTVVRNLLLREAAYRSLFRKTALVHYDPEWLKIIYDELLAEAGVKLLLHALATEVVRRGDRMVSVTIATRGETIQLSANVFVDTTGDAELCSRAGLATLCGDERGGVQPGTLVFRMAGVDVQTALRLGRGMLNEQMKSDSESGYFALPYTGGSFYATTNKGEVVVNVTRVLGVNGTHPEELTKGEIQGRRQVQEYVRWFRERWQGFEHAYLSAAGVQLGLRETRRIIGRSQLLADGIRAGQRVESDLAIAAWPIEIHSSEGDGTRVEWLPDDCTYGIPLGAAVPRELTNVLVAGRCLSATREAMASSRVIGTCYSVGEAIGAVASRRARDQRDVGDWTVGTLTDVEAWRREAGEPGPNAWPTGQMI